MTEKEVKQFKKEAEDLWFKMHRFIDDYYLTYGAEEWFETLVSAKGELSDMLESKRKG